MWTTYVTSVTVLLFVDKIFLEKECLKQTSRIQVNKSIMGSSQSQNKYLEIVSLLYLQGEDQNAT